MPIKFSKIRHDGASVILEWENVTAFGEETVTLKDAESPTPKFRDALQAFRPFATKLLGLEAWTDSEVRSLSLVEHEGLRGLQVTLVRTIAGARNRVATITTPFLSEQPEDSNGDGTGFLDDMTMKLIDVVEEYAEGYRNGERGEQMKLPLTGNAKDVDDKMREASTASTRKPKGKKPIADDRQADIESSAGKAD